jgi:hypothetical protein
MFTPRTASFVPAVLAVLLVAGCGSSGSSSGSGSSGSSGSGLSVQQRLQTGQVCADVAGSVSTAAQVGLKLANGSITQAAATTQLQPVTKHVSDLASQNAALPIGTSLKQLSDSIGKVEAISPTNVADVKAAGSQLTTTTKDLLASCAAIRH